MPPFNAETPAANKARPARAKPLLPLSSILSPRGYGIHTFLLGDLGDYVMPGLVPGIHVS
jgi:hypothetical protein